MEPIQNQKIVESIIAECEQAFRQELPEQAHLALRRRLQELMQRSLTPPDLAESRQVTILLSDLRGFTTMSEHMPPLDVAKLLNRYFGRMSQVVFKYDGVIDKFMGDAIMVLFGAPVSGNHDLLRAIACATEMQIAMSDINASGAEEGLPAIYMGIGIDCGEVFAGTLGSELHREYTVIGDHVNLASRIEAHSLRGQVLISERSYLLARPHIQVSASREVLLKGKRDPVRIFELQSIDFPTRLEVPQLEWRSSHRVDVDMPFRCQLVEDKTVGEEVLLGQILDISYHGIRARLPLRLEPGAALKLRINLGLLSGEQSAIYAQVLRCESVDDGYESSIEFSSMDQDAERAVRRFVDSHVS